MLQDVNHLANDGFRIPDRGGRLIDLSLPSLKLALKAYFSTYHVMKFNLHAFEPSADLEQSESDYQHNGGFFESCSETVVHFQHFAELFIKEALRKEHPLLANEASSRPLILYKLLKREPIEPNEQESINSIQFGDALRRFLCLVEEGKLKDRKLYFVKDHQLALEKLNTLRNRMWHRGTFILRYPALDAFVGLYVLPFIGRIFEIKRYSKLIDVWKYAPLQCKIDPVIELEKHFQTGAYDIGKVALLKELGFTMSAANTR